MTTRVLHVRSILGALLVLTAALLTAPAAAQQDGGGGITAFTDVTVVPMDRERTIENQTVIVRGGRIESVGPAATTAVPAGATRIDGRGKFLMPGLAEMHAHIPGTNAPEQLVHDIMYLYVANGITTIRGMLGAPNQLALREQTASGALLGPTIFVGAPSLNGQATPTPEAAREQVQRHDAAGYDFLKLHPGLTRPVYDAIVATARAEDITWAGHVSADVGLEHTLATRQSTIDHLDGYLEAVAADSVQAKRRAGQASLRDLVWGADAARMRRWAEATRDAGVWNVPTMVIWDHLFTIADVDTFARRDEVRYVPRQMAANWAQALRTRNEQHAQNDMTAADLVEMREVRRRILKALADAGAPLLLGTDSPQIFSVPGFSLHREIAAMQDAGLTPYQILESGTRNIARYAAEDLELDGSFGTVAPGQRADLLLLDANPLTDARNVARRAGVMVRGRWLAADEIRRGLEEIAARNAGGE